MADSYVELNPGLNGEKAATFKDSGNQQHQKVILETQTGSSDPAEVNASNPLPVSVQGTVPISGSVAAAVSGTVAATQSGAWNVNAHDGAGNALTSKNPGSERALSVAIVDGSGNQVTSFGGTGGTSLTDDAAFTAGTTAITPVGGTYRSTRDAVDDNDAGAFAMTSRRAQLVCLETPNGDSAMDDTADAVKTVVSAALPAGTNNIGDVDVLTLPNVTLATGTNTNEVVGDVAHDAAAAGNPLLMGGYASSSAPSAVSADGDAVRQWLTRNGAANAMLRDSSGDSCMDDTNNALRVNIVAGAGSGGTAAADDADFTAGTTQATPIMGVYESSPTSVTDGDMGVVGITANRAMKVSISAGGISGVVDDAAVTPGTTEGVAMMATFDDTSPDSVDEGDGGMVRMSANRNLYVRIRDNAGNERGLNIDGNGALAATVTNATAANLNAQIVGAAAADAAVSGNPVLMGGRASTATPSAMSADGDAVATWLTRSGAQVVSGDVVDDAAFTPGTSRVQPIAFQADETATDSVDEGDAGTPRMTLDRKVIVTSYGHAAAGGATSYKNLDVDETEDDIKTSAGKLFWIHVVNLANAKRYLKIYNNVAASVTVGTTTPDHTFPIPTMGDTNGAGFCLNFGALGLQFTTGICIAATTGFADNDTGAPGANEIILNAGYL